MHTHGNSEGSLLVGLGFGLVLFVRGLRLYRTKLLVADTKIIPTRSVAMGVVQIQGTAKEGKPFPSPVSGTPCYAYQVRIERWTSGSRGGHWSHQRTDQNGTPFYLEDGSGRVLVDPREAEFNLPPHCLRQVPPSAMRSILEKEPGLSPTGTGAERDGMSEAPSDEVLLLYAGQPGLFGSGRFRFTEYCILPERQYDVLGTCVENPHPQDENDRNLIAKGQNEHTYLISSRSERVLERNLSWRSALMVWGGGALAVACAAILLAEYGRL